ncbi:hypothetical protein [Shewanella litorisediminis]|uniref:Uncharacterized protein n=1 Tax=Shewanella litorisediminis TaxID=1173586 RepID=A0ABX7G594_9GAMM|nr:hypothetical protein [Shewanella litorisediminis]MCL2917994.1 hypothetical protein [Shewanella litorisediminis]QRH02427.1 hypothetical protein JQC75_03090 [Shewanella litorisediminis]
MDLFLLLLALIVSVGWFLYSKYQSDHWHQRHRHCRHKKHPVVPHELEIPKEFGVYESLEEVEHQARINGTRPQGLHPFHCVSVVAGQNDCDARQAIDGQRFLSGEAPAIPLKGCNAEACHCHYQHFEDRRMPHSDRRARYGLTEELYGHFGEKNKRQLPRGRRITDV